jgi:hypothetical protein
VATQADVRRIALSLPGAEQPPDRYAYAILNHGTLKKFVWAWRERVTPKKPRVPNFNVIAVRVADLKDKERLLAEKPAACFTEPHYNGFPAVLVLAYIVPTGAQGLSLKDGAAQHPLGR